MEIVEVVDFDMIIVVLNWLLEISCGMILLEYGLIGFVLGGGVIVGGGILVLYMGCLFFMLMGLDVEMDYEFYVCKVCGGGVFENFCLVIFFIGCNLLGFIFFIGFELEGLCGIFCNIECLLIGIW